jgi:hypothetical protein
MEEKMAEERYAEKIKSLIDRKDTHQLWGEVLAL